MCLSTLSDFMQINNTCKFVKFSCSNLLTKLQKCIIINDEKIGKGADRSLSCLRLFHIYPLLNTRCTKAEGIVPLAENGAECFLIC